MRNAHFHAQGEVRFGSRDNNVRDDGQTKYFALYQQAMKNEENLKRELKSLYFGSFNRDQPRLSNQVSLLRLVVYKNAASSDELFPNGQIDESNVF